MRIQEIIYKLPTKRTRHVDDQLAFHVHDTKKGEKQTHRVRSYKFLHIINQPRLAAAKRGLLPWARAIQLIYPGRPKQEIFK
jgi:hypothetical protein